MSHDLAFNGRFLFTDGWNSFWHLIFGIMSYFDSRVTVIFLIYQLIDFTDKNLAIDVSEFTIGFMLCLFFFRKVHNNTKLRIFRLINS